jgi:hypothetical protein
MRGIALGATLGAAALLAVVPTSAQAQDASGPMTVTGGITITWAGDPARGCAAAGLCGYSGSSQVAAGSGRSEYYLTVEGGHLYGESSRMDLAGPMAVRVQRSEGGVERGVCTDRVEGPYFALGSRRAKRGRARFAVDGPDVSTARCAGPGALWRAVTRLPSRAVPFKQVAHGNTTVDLSGSAPYASGRFSGTVTSTLKFHFGPARAGNPMNSRARAARARRPGRVVDVHAVYRIVGYRGKLSATFGGLTAPPCASFDLCGAAGSVEWAVRSARGLVLIDADATARRGDHGLRGAIAAIGRRNALMNAWAGVPYNVPGTTTAEVTRPDGATCHDAVRVTSPGLDVNSFKSPVWVELGGPDAYPSDGDIVRAGCAGPRDPDVFGDDSIAAGALPLSGLAKRSFKVRLKGGGQFSGPGYSGAQTSRFTLSLRRVVVRATYSRPPGTFRTVAPGRR